jgi:hypothetical protein
MRSIREIAGQLRALLCLARMLEANPAPLPPSQVTEHIKTKLQQHSLVRIYPNIHLMPSSHQV